MWHWNSLWAPAPGDPPAVDDPRLYRAPWTSEQAYVMQARSWDTLVSASRAWWTFWMAALPLPGQALVTVAPPTSTHAPPVAPLNPLPDTLPDAPDDPPRAAGLKDGAARSPRPSRRQATAAGASHPPRAESRPGKQARKR